MPTDNATILQAAKTVGVSDYQLFMDKITQQSTKQMVDALFDPMNRMYYNMFCDVLVNRIGRVWVSQHSFEDPLNVFKQANLNYGNTVEMAAVDYIKTQQYQLNEPEPTETGNTIFKTYYPKAKTAFVSTNQFRQYPITVNNQLLRQAFVDDYGLNDFVSQILRRPFDSDNYAEYRATLNSIKELDDKNPNMVYRHTAYSAEPTTHDLSVQFLQDLRAYVAKMRFPNLVRRYIPADMPSTYQPDQLILMVTPEVNAAMQVSAYATLFNLEEARAQTRVIIVDDFNIEGCFAALVSERTLMQMDVTFENNSIYNPKNLSTNYFLTHLQIIAANPFEPIVLFGYGANWNATETTTITETATGITLASLDGLTVARGGVARLNPTLTGTLAIAPATESLNPDVAVSPDSVTYTVEGGDGVTLNSRTYVDVRDNTLHVQRTGLKAGDTIKVTATAVYDDSYTASLTFTVA